MQGDEVKYGGKAAVSSHVCAAETSHYLYEKYIHLHNIYST